MPYFDREAVEQYQRDGFIVSRGLVKGRRLKSFLAMSDRLLSLPEDAGADVWKFYDESATPEPALIRVEKFVYAFTEWRRFVLRGEIFERIGELLGARASLFKEKLILKPAGGDAIGPHQEMHTDWGAYGDSFLVAAIALDRCTAENGCLQVSAGDHRRGLIGKHGRTMTSKEKKGLHFHEVRMEPGDCLFFDSWTPHQSGPNETEHPRRILFLAFNRSAAGDHYDAYFENKAAEYWPGEKTSTKSVRTYYL